EYIDARREDIGDTRENLASNPRMIYRLDTLLQASYQAQNIQRDSIFDLIVRDRARDVAVSHAILGVALAVLAIAAGLLTAGGGTVAVVAAGVGLGLGAWSVLDEYREYERQSAAHGAGLLSEDPTLAWVVVAVIGAGFDLAAVAGAVRAMRPAVQAFNASGDVAALERSLAELAEISDALRANVVRAARAEQQYRQAVRGLLATGGRLNVVLIPGAEQFAQLLVVAYYAAKRGVIYFGDYLLELRAQGLIARIEDLTPDQMGQLRRAFTEGVERSRRGGLLEYPSLSQQIRGVYTAEQVDQIATRGKQLGLADEQITDFLEMGSIAKPNRRPPKLPLTPAQVMDQMQNWRTVIQPRGYPYLFDSLQQFQAFRDQLRFLIRRHGVPDGRLVLQGSALRNPLARDVDVAIFVSDEVFAQYAARCRAGIQQRTGQRAVARILEQFDYNVERGFIAKFHFDRPPASTSFGDDAHDLLEEQFGFALDISVMKRSSSLAMYPSLDM
ncbi:MAG TPA: hypothetical protein VEQ60_00800, partial [Longimicrobium sp.]|nr:hypothetical protein [Longimicrobium sp.]